MAVDTKIPLAAATPQLPQEAAVIQQGIDNVRNQNIRANAELTGILDDMRAGISGVDPTTVHTDGGDATNLQYQRIMLTNSQWASKVIMAAVLDQGFKEELGVRAHAILVEAGAIPAEETSPEAVPPSVIHL